MSNFPSSFDTTWMYGHDLKELLDWISDQALEGYELKSLTATASPTTEFDSKTGKRIDMWRHHYVAVVQKPNA